VTKALLRGAARVSRTPFPGPRPITFGIFSTVVRDGRGRLKYRSRRHNLRTTAGGDWQATVLATGSVNSTYDTGTAAATTATTVTLPTSGAPGGTGVWNGRIISLANRWGVILSNTNASPPVLTIDGWHTPTAPGTIGSTPAAGVYNILPGQASIMYLALTADATAPAAGDTALATELAANGFTRAFFTTYSHTGGTAAVALANTFTCTGGSTTINKEGVFIAANGASGGDVMPFESAEPSPPTLISGDTLAQTVTINY
jgi:hypothetical protein